MVYQLVSMLLLQALHSPLKIYSDIIIALYMFSDGLIYAKLLKNVRPTSKTLLILPDSPSFDVNEA